MVITDRRVLIKHSAKEDSHWQFTFQSEDLSVLRSDISKGAKTFVGLVCGKVTVCALSQVEIEALIDLDSKQSQWIRVELPPNSSMRVRGSKGDWKRVIPHNSFPTKLFA